MEFMGNTVLLAGLASIFQFRVFLFCRSASSFFLSTTAVLFPSFFKRQKQQQEGGMSRVQRNVAENVAVFMIHDE
jgi:hypothetical protein